ncbi:MYXO-CTERM domain-containing protein [Saccharomonospora amisosensis]|uniref:MYXO-CTERM domain-containing protein n=1 Tax=Saccharomonospora amisosensis TaxID=1128677 RepID=A0A7X5UR79_9PSEU|nr:WGxxGxxG family protein [Saccharomonospora amisosensis]NIJ12724.1 MYXO-CTERM domain-containing protein [Saccharomonospora amisosensis]
MSTTAGRLLAVAMLSMALSLGPASAAGVQSQAAAAVAGEPRHTQAQGGSSAWGLFGLLGLLGLLGLARKPPRRVVSDPLARYPSAKQPIMPHPDLDDGSGRRVGAAGGPGAVSIGGVGGLQLPAAPLPPGEEYGSVDPDCPRWPRHHYR